MTGQDRLLRSSLPEVLATDYIRTARAEQAVDEGRRSGSQRQRRQDQMLEPTPTTRRQPIQAHGKEQDQHDSQEEVGDRLPDQREHHAEAVDDRVGKQRRQNAHGYRDDERDQQRQAHQLQRGRHAAEHHVHGGLLVPNRHAEVALNGSANEIDVLHGQRTVEAERLAQLRHILRRRV